MQRRILLVTVLAFMFFVASGDVCDGTYDVFFKLTNSGRDPVHINGHRIAVGETKNFAEVSAGKTQTFTITRDDINLGTLTMEVDADLEENPDCDITMTEPVYFQLQFTANCPYATVSYTGP